MIPVTAQPFPFTPSLSYAPPVPPRVTFGPSFKYSSLEWEHLTTLQSFWRPSPFFWRPSLLRWRPSLLGGRPSLLGWRTSLLGCRPSLLGSILIWSENTSQLFQHVHFQSLNVLFSFPPGLLSLAPPEAESRFQTKSPVALLPSHQLSRLSKKVWAYASNAKTANANQPPRRMGAAFVSIFRACWATENVRQI